MGNSFSKDNNTSKLYNSNNESYHDEYELKSQSLLQEFLNKNQSTNIQTETAEDTKIIFSSEIKIPFKFEWREGGTNVKLAGSFLDNWKKQVEMTKNMITGFFEVNLDVPLGIHQFKFIVDKKWVCSPKYSIINDKNHANNIIDFTNYSHKMNRKGDIEKSHTKKKKKKPLKETIEFSCTFPKTSEVNSEAPGIPQLFLPCFDLNNQTKQEYLKSRFKNCLELNKRKSIIESNTFKEIIAFPHSQLSHICYNVGIENNRDKDNYLRTAITQRIKHKFLTIIYFTPKSVE